MLATWLRMLKTIIPVNNLESYEQCPRMSELVTSAQRFSVEIFVQGLPLATKVSNIKFAAQLNSVTLTEMRPYEPLHPD